MARVKSSRKILCVLIFLTISACSLVDDPQVLQDIKTPFKEVATYHHYFSTRRNYVSSRRHKVILVKPEISEEDAYQLAWRLRKAYPNTTFELFDDESKIKEYVRWDTEKNSEQRAQMSELAMPEDLKDYIRKHRVWSVYNGEIGGDYKWSLWNKKGDWVRGLE